MGTINTDISYIFEKLYPRSNEDAIRVLVDIYRYIINVVSARLNILLLRLHTTTITDKEVTLVCKAMIGSMYCTRHVDSIPLPIIRGEIERLLSKGSRISKRGVSKLSDVILNIIDDITVKKTHRDIKISILEDINLRKILYKVVLGGGVREIE